MSDLTSEVLACRLWDLRAQCELDLRVLTQCNVSWRPALLAACKGGGKDRGHPATQELLREIRKLVPVVEVALYTAHACRDEAGARLAAQCTRQ